VDSRIPLVDQAAQAFGDRADIEAVRFAFTFCWATWRLFLIEPFQTLRMWFSLQ
jgi:hypothetical protein